jgi:hypothetical protein
MLVASSMIFDCHSLSIETRRSAVASRMAGLV